MFEGILGVRAAELDHRLGELGGEPFVHELLTGLAVEVDNRASTTWAAVRVHEDRYRSTPAPDDAL